MLQMKNSTRLFFASLFAAMLASAADAGTICPGPLSNVQSGEIIATPKVYVDYWQFNGSDPNQNKQIIEAVLNNIGGSKYFNIMGQYYGYDFGVPYYFANPISLLKGEWEDDTNAIPTHTCVDNMDGNGCTCSPLTCYLGPTAVEVGQEAVRAAAAMGIDQSDPNNIVMVVGPNGATFGGIGCAYHAAITNSTYPILKFITEPYVNASYAGCNGEPDPVSSLSLLVQHETAETITDPYPFVADVPADDVVSWFGPPYTRWDGKQFGGCEIGDLCVPGPAYNAWDGGAGVASPITIQIQPTGSAISRIKVHPLYSNWGAGCVNAQATTAWSFYVTSDGNLWALQVDRDGNLLYNVNWGKASEGGTAYNFTSAPGSASWGVNRLDVYAVDANGHLGHRASTDGGHTIPVDDWGRLPTFYSYVGKPDVSSWGSGRLDIFIRGYYSISRSNTLFHRSWDNGTDSGWVNIGTPTGGVGSAPTAVSTSPGTIDLFVMNTLGVLYHSHSNDGSTFGTWESWGAPPYTFTGDPDSASWGPSQTMDKGASAFRLDVFVMAQNGTLMHRFSTSGDNTTGFWVSETDPGTALVGSPSVVGMGDQRYTVMVPTSIGRFSQEIVSFGGSTWNNQTTIYSPVGGASLTGW